jgi:hypothetical protein
MRMRGLAAVVVGIVGAAGTHALDAAGLLPGVHETADVRTAMGPVATVVWLALAGALAWLAARTRPAIVGGSAALVVSAIPELLGRHDIGAVVEPGAMSGALVQWLLLLAVVAIAVVVDRWLAVHPPSSYLALPWQQSIVGRSRNVSRLVDRRGRPRAPPVVVLLPATVF